MLLVVTILTRYISLAANQNRHALFKTNLDGIQEKEFKFLFFLNRSYNLSLKQINKKQIELFFYFMVFTTCKKEIVKEVKLVKVANKMYRISIPSFRLEFQIENTIWKFWFVCCT